MSLSISSSMPSSSLQSNSQMLTAAEVPGIARLQQSAMTTSSPEERSREKMLAEAKSSQPDIDPVPELRNLTDPWDPTDSSVSPPGSSASLAKSTASNSRSLFLESQMLIATINASEVQGRGQWQPEQILELYRYQ